jgi:TPR repeat protein
LPDISPAKGAGLVTVDNSPLVLRRPAQATLENASAAEKDRNQGTRMDLAALVARGDQFLGFRDLNAARSFYERAAALGSGQAALHMGMTFDPAFLSRVGLHAAYGNPTQAASWYRHAAELGDTEAIELQNSTEAQLRGRTSKN